MSRKFDNPRTERLFTKFEPDETIEPGDGMGWLGLYLVRDRGGAIIYEDAHGFTDGTYYESPNQAWIAWTEAKDKWTPEAESPNPSDILIVIPGEAGDRWYVQAPGGVNGYDSYEAALNFAVAGQMKSVEDGDPISVWTIDQKGISIRVYPEPVSPSR